MKRTSLPRILQILLLVRRKKYFTPCHRGISVGMAYQLDLGIPVGVAYQLNLGIPVGLDYQILEYQFTCQLDELFEHWATNQMEHRSAGLFEYHWTWWSSLLLGIPVYLVTQVSLFKYFIVTTYPWIQKRKEHQDNEILVYFSTSQCHGTPVYLQSYLLDQSTFTLVDKSSPEVACGVKKGSQHPEKSWHQWTCKELDNLRSL